MTDPELLERHLSVERLGPYRRAAGGDLAAALRLYEWNSAIAAAFFEVLGHFEVILRNAMGEQLAAEHARAGRPGYWYDSTNSATESPTTNRSTTSDWTATVPTHYASLVTSILDLVAGWARSIGSHRSVGRHHAEAIPPPWHHWRRASRDDLLPPPHGRGNAVLPGIEIRNGWPTTQS